MNQQVNEEVRKQISFLCTLLPDPLTIDEENIQRSKEHHFTIDLGETDRSQEEKMDFFFRSSTVLVRHHLKTGTLGSSEDWEIWEHLFTKVNNTLYRTTHFICHHTDELGGMDQKHICTIASVPFSLEVDSSPKESIGKQNIKRRFPIFSKKK